MINSFLMIILDDSASKIKSVKIVEMTPYIKEFVSQYYIALSQESNYFSVFFFK